MAAMHLKDFWPSDQHCRECLITEAETADDAVFLAVHQPMRITWKLHGVTTAGEIKREEDVLRALLVPNPASGTLVLPIVGGSGVGKSHLIRWLDSHLRLRADHSSRHVVRIPKSASLRGVLELILEHLPDRMYGELRRKLLSAQMPPTLLEATRRLQANLLVELENAGREAQQRITELRPRHDDRARAAHCSSLGLIALLQDPQLGSHFAAHEGTAKGVLSRIADRCLHGSRENDKGPQNQFFPADLESVLQEVNTAKITRAYIATIKQPQALAAAVGFLNEVVDRAVGHLMDFRGASLSELFVEIRTKLLEDKKELVLLVEDFAVLAGIQGHLLDAMIREATRNGRQELCVMRTALAVTEGRLPEGVMTRAQAEWKIDQKPFQTEEEAVQCFTDFVGGYLNAARWGAAKLRAAFGQRPANAKNVTDWVPNFFDEHESALSEEESKSLKAFGVSHREGHMLFPFNREAVRQLARQFLREGDAFKYEPRLLINRLLRATLLHYQEAFAAGAFPPAGIYSFAENRLALDVAGELRTKTGTMFSRMAVLVYYWAADPRSVGQAAAIEPAIFQSFGLTPIDWSAKAEKKRSEPLSKTTTPTVEPPVSAGDPAGPWTEILDAWQSKGQLGQNDANRMRNFLDEAIHEWLDWEALLLRRIVTRNKRIYLPGAQQSNPPVAEALAVAATETDLKDSGYSISFFRSMRAVARYHTKKDWLYEDGESDAALYANLIERLAEDAARYYRRQGSELKPTAVLPLAQALLIDARLLNLPGATSNNDTENIAAIFEPAKELPASHPDDPWSRLRASAHQTRGDLQALLLKAAGARQGAGANVYAVDAVNLLEAVGQLRRNDWQLANDFEIELFRDELVSVKEHLLQLKRLKIATEQRRSALSDWRKIVTDAFGEDFEVPEVVDALRELAKAANDQGVFRPRDPSHDSLRSRIREMGPIKETLLQAEKIGDPSTAFGVVLSALAQVDEKTVEKVRSIIADYRRFVKDTSAEVDSRIGETPASLDDEAEKLEVLFQKLDGIWTKAEEVTRE